MDTQRNLFQIPFCLVGFPTPPRSPDGHLESCLHQSLVIIKHLSISEDLNNRLSLNLETLWSQKMVPISPAQLRYTTRSTWAGTSACTSLCCVALPVCTEQAEGYPCSTIRYHFRVGFTNWTFIWNGVCKARQSSTAEHPRSSMLAR